MYDIVAGRIFDYWILIGMLLALASMVLMYLAWNASIKPFRDIDAAREQVRDKMVEVAGAVLPIDRAGAAVEAAKKAALDAITAAITIARTPPPAGAPVTSAADALFALKTKVEGSFGALPPPPPDGKDTQAAVIGALKGYNPAKTTPASRDPEQEKRAYRYAQIGFACFAVALVLMGAGAARFSETAARTYTEELLAAFANYGRYSASAKEKRSQELFYRGVLAGVKESAQEQRESLTKEIYRLRQEQVEDDAKAKEAAEAVKAAMDKAKKAYREGELDRIIANWKPPQAPTDEAQAKTSDRTVREVGASMALPPPPHQP